MNHLYLGISLNSETSSFDPKDIVDSLSQFLTNKCADKNPIVEVDVIEHSGSCLESCSTLNEHRDSDE